MLRLFSALGLAATLAACASFPVGGKVEQPRVLVARNGADWTADFVLPGDSAVWGFTRSALKTDTRKPWRPEQWSVETPGVVLERHGHLDVLRSVDGGPVPRQLRIRFRPRAANLEADYDPALVFTEGSVALFSGHFDLFPVSSVEAAAALPIDLNEADIQGEGSRITWRDRAGPVLHEGQRQREPISEGRGHYVLFGEAALVDSPRLATVIDPQLPSWIGQEIGEFAPRVADYYVSRLGAGQTTKPTIMISWNGPTPGKRSMGGSVLASLIIMSFEGERVVEPSRALGDQARWFIGHESAHFWLGQTVRYEVSRDAWIAEGGADLMAIRALSSIDPDYDARAELQQEVDDCISLADEPVATANSRSEHRAYYACGAVFALAAEAAQRRKTGGDWFDFLKPLIDANRQDGILTREEWLTAFSDTVGETAPRREIETLLDQGSADAAGIVGRLFQATGVAFRLEEGKPSLI